MRGTLGDPEGDWMFYRKTVLDNALTVISEPMDEVRSMALGIWFAVGSRDEAPEEAGMSHFMEHMMFKGTPTRSAREISEAFDRLGSELNAFTAKEYTCYYARFVDQHLDSAFGLLADMVVNATLDQEACVSEREVVIEEIARSEDTPDDLIHDVFGETLWPGQPLGLPILGNRQTVGGFDHEQSLKFRDRHYLTGNCVVAAAGNVEHEKLVELSQQLLTLKEAPRTQRPVAHSVARSNQRIINRETEQAHICFGVSTMNAHHPDRFTLTLLDNVLGGGMSSRLFQEIREKRGLVYAVYSFTALYQDTGEFGVYAGTRPENAEEVIRLIQQEVAKVAESGITIDELDRARQAAKGHLVLGMEATRNRMTRLGKNEVTAGEILSIDELMDRLEAVTMDDIKRVSAEVLSAEKVLAVIGPFDETSFPGVV